MHTSVKLNEATKIQSITTTPALPQACSDSVPARTPPAPKAISLLIFSPLYINFFCPGTSYKQNHRVGTLFPLASFPQRAVFEIHPWYCMRQYFHSFCCERVLSYDDIMSRPQFIHSPVDKDLSCFQFMAFMNKADMVICLQALRHIYVFIFLR